MADDKPKKKRERGQGSIGNVPGSRFLYIWYYDNAGKQQRESTGSELRSVAQAILNERLAAMGRGEKSPTEIRSIRYEDMRSILIANYRENRIGELVEEKDEKGIAKTYVKGTGLKELDAYFRGMRLNQIETQVLRAFREHRKKQSGVGDTTINRNLALLRRMMRLTAWERNLQFVIPHFPMTSEGGNARKGFLKPEQFVKLRNAMPEHLHPLITFLYTVGCRIGAAKKIVWDWVDLQEEVIEIPEGVLKNDEPLTVPIDPELLPMLKKLFRKSGAPVFDTTNFRKEFEKACVAVGLGKLVKVKSPKGYWFNKYEGVIPHDFRRSAVRNMTRAGNSSTIAMSISGHKTDHIFRRYNITDIEDKKEAAKKVSEYNSKRRKAVSE
jgi:integrase